MYIYSGVYVIDIVVRFCLFWLESGNHVRVCFDERLYIILRGVVLIVRFAIQIMARAEPRGEIQRGSFVSELLRPHVQGSEATAMCRVVAVIAPDTYACGKGNTRFALQFDELAPNRFRVRRLASVAANAIVTRVNYSACLARGVCQSQCLSSRIVFATVACDGISNCTAGLAGSGPLQREELSCRAFAQHLQG